MHRRAIPRKTVEYYMGKDGGPLHGTYRLVSAEGLAVGVALLATSPRLSLDEIESFIWRGEGEYARLEEDDPALVRALELVKVYDTGRHGRSLVVRQPLEDVLESGGDRYVFVDHGKPHLVLFGFDPIASGVSAEDWAKYKYRYAVPPFHEYRPEGRAKDSGRSLFAKASPVFDAYGPGDARRLRRK